MTCVKICGITCWADARLAVDLGARMLGFNFWPSSPRYISPEAARRIIQRLPKETAAAGVFVDTPADDVDSTARFARLDFVQLHGRPSLRAVTQLAEAYGVIQAFRVRRGFRLERLARFGEIAALLLDAYSPGLPGGTGRTFDWSVAAQAKRHGCVILAGGLTPANVGEAIRAARPDAVDVSSGVERAPGKKDPQKLREFFRAVEAADAALGAAARASRTSAGNGAQP